MDDSERGIDSMEDLEGISGESFMNYVCAYERIIQVVFSISIFFMFLSLAGFVFLEWGSASHVVAAVNLVTLLGFTAVSGAALYVCKDRA